MTRIFLLADSGATKTDWLLVGADTIPLRIETQGISPIHMDDATMKHVLTDELLPKLGFEASRAEAVYFYGAGQRGELAERTERVLTQVFASADTNVASDMLGAARALFGNEAGVACILGTGSNSCFYDGTGISDQIPPLGYVLGDEGSGASLGKRLVADVIKRQLPQEICNLFWEQTAYGESEIIERVYRQPMPSRFLAIYTRFLSTYSDVPALSALITDEFVRFFQRNVMAYGHKEKPVGFVGSIASVFHKQLTVAADRCGLFVGKILKAPIEALAGYHLMHTA